MERFAPPLSLSRRVWDDVRPRRGYERLLWCAGAVLLVSAALHAVVWVMSGESWSGPVSWRKPIVFGFSFGVTLLSMGWILSHLPAAGRPGRVVAWGLVASSFAEVGLITMQRWRGVASHFNFATDFDAAVFAAMGVAISVFAALTVVVLAWAALRATAGPARMAALGGLLLLLVGQGLGGPLIAQGSATALVTGAVPDQVTVGTQGAGKLPHGIGIHGLQVLLTLAVLLNIGSLAPAARRRAMLTAIAGCGVLLGWALMQTYLGRAPLDLTPALGAVLFTGAGLVAGAYGRAVVAVRRAEPPAAAPGRGTADELAATVSG